MTNPEHDYAAFERMRGAAKVMYSALEYINALACYASEENPVVAKEALLEIGRVARASCAQVEGRS